MTLFFTFLLPLLISFAIGQQYGYQNQHNNYPSLDSSEKFPWVVAVLNTDDLFTRYIGSGSLIKPNVVLTAVHILNDISENELVVRAGENDISTTQDQQHVDLKVLRIVAHEQFNKYNAENNVALLILKSGFTMTRNIQTIALYMGGGRVQRNSCFFNGWGKEEWNSKDYPSTLKNTKIEIIENDICQRILGWPLSTRQFCAKGLQGKDCSGDGGAPVVCKTGENPYTLAQVGVVNWGSRKPSDNKPTIYTNVYSLRGWIEYQLRLPANFVPDLIVEAV
ncbi:phenoloxidase-activating factor 2 [Drosophila subpulchrella]|uniref:phenoloxidase-activating factor 2 n=1 Tax=Drosophila subpulchrella TaxID=1486046 RepID=UPI0018A1A185|nr:phenoloxidase-activating factor 2 [Drosophila subpulchrella]